MKKAILFLFLVMLACPAMAQTHAKKQTTEEMSTKTPDQRFVYETERKAKKKKKRNISTKKKVKVQQKQDKQMRKKKVSQRAR